MEFEMKAAVAVLERPPLVWRAWLGGLPEEWTRGVEGPGTWSAYDVVGHLIHGERTDWIPRVEHLLAHGEAVAFPPFDRMGRPEDRPLDELLEEFAVARRASLRRLAELGLDDRDMARTGRHPEFGPVTLGQLLATWVVHDLDHVAQVARVMGRQYGAAVGPWRAYLRIVRD